MKQKYEYIKGSFKRTFLQFSDDKVTHHVMAIYPVFKFCCYVMTFVMLSKRLLEKLLLLHHACLRK